MNETDELARLLQQREAERYKLLMWIYQTTGGDQLRIAVLEDRRNSIGIGPAELRVALQYLVGEGLIANFGAGGRYRITHAGVVEIEHTIRHRSSPTEHFSPVTILNFNAPVGVVQHGSGNESNVSLRGKSDDDPSALG